MAQDLRAFRKALGRFATGVAIATVAKGTASGLGVTINSFASVSLEPALVLWSLDRQSECLKAFAGATGFAIHVLTADQQDLSNRFSRKDHHELDGLSIRHGLAGAPILEDCHAWFDCRIAARHDGGDHVIFLGEVLDFGEREAEPLLYYAGGYRGLAL